MKMEDGKPPFKTTGDASSSKRNISRRSEGALIG